MLIMMCNHSQLVLVAKFGVVQKLPAFKVESIKKGPFYVAKMKIQNLKAIISRTPGIFGTKTH